MTDSVATTPSTGLDRRQFLATAAAASVIGFTGPSQAAPSAIVNMSANDLSAAIRTKKVSCREVMTAYLDHIDRINPQFNAIVSRVDRAQLMTQAAAADADLAKGTVRGWMHGFPHAVKDLAYTKGIRTTLGSPILAEYVPTSDAIFVERLKANGAILIGKTNTPEFGLGSQTYNKVFGVTGNAYDSSKTAGGSSGGADTKAELARTKEALTSREQEARKAGELGGEQIADRLEALRLETRALSAAIENWGGANELLARVAADCAELRHAIASSSILTDGLRISHDREIAPIKSMLDQLGDDVAWAVFKARWIGKSPAPRGMAFWDVEARLLRAAGDTPADLAFAKLGPGKPDGPWAAMESLPECVLSCERSQTSWALALRPLLSQGKLGEPFAQWSV